MRNVLVKFAGKAVTSTTPYQLWEAIQHGALVCTDIDAQVASLRDPVSEEVCFIFWDECAQMSMPYPTYAAAKSAFSDYVTNYL